MRPSREDASRDFCGRCNGVFQIARTKPCAQFESFITEAEHGHWLGAELDGYEFKGNFVGHESLAKMAESEGGPTFDRLRIAATTGSMISALLRQHGSANSGRRGL